MPDPYEFEVEAIDMMFLTCRSDAIGIAVVRSHLQWKATMMMICFFKESSSWLHISMGSPSSSSMT